jgi:alpha-aminoadipate carrier protein LysW
VLQKLTGAGRLSLARQKRQAGSSNCGDVSLPKNLVGGREVPTGTCPECDADVHVDTDTDKGESVSCEECGVELEVVGLDPVELDIVEEDDLDDDEDEDEF